MIVFFAPVTGAVVTDPYFLTTHYGLAIRRLPAIPFGWIEVFTGLADAHFFCIDFNTFNIFFAEYIYRVQRLFHDILVAFLVFICHGDYLVPSTLRQRFGSAQRPAQCPMGI